jgi:hypothetical protein
MERKRTQIAERLAYWESVMQEQKESGQSIIEYCHTKGLQVYTFHYWRRKLKGLETSDASIIESSYPESIGFTEVKIKEIGTHTKGAIDGSLRIEISDITIYAEVSYPTEKLGSLLKLLAKS